MSDGRFQLPVVDFSPFSNVEKVGGDESAGKMNDSNKMAVAKAIDDACRHHGFVCLRNSGIPHKTVAKAFEASQSLFQMSTEDKKSKLSKLNPTTNTGYNGLQAEALNRRRAPDLKEVFNVKCPQRNPESLTGTPANFEESATAMWEQTTLLSHRFAECCAMALGLDNNYFSKTLQEMDLCTLRMLCYPPCPLETKGGDGHDDARSSIRVGEHTDFGAYTFLFVHDMKSPSSHGLQVKPIEGADLGSGSLVDHNDDMFTKGWKDVVLDPMLLDEMVENDDTCPVLVNTGALMARWTNDVWRATAHRVIVAPEARNSYRYSMAMFVDPDKTTQVEVHPKFVSKGEQPKYPPINSFNYLLMKLKEAQELGGDADEKKKKKKKDTSPSQ